MAAKRAHDPHGLSDDKTKRLKDELNSNPDSFDESEKEDLLDGSSDHTEVGLAEGNSDIDTDFTVFTDGIRYTLGEGETGSTNVDFGAIIDRTEEFLGKTDEPANFNEATPVPINAEEIENQGKVEAIKRRCTSTPELKKVPWTLVDKGNDVETVADSKKFCSNARGSITTASWSPIAFDLPEYPLQRKEIPIGEMIKEVDKMQKYSHSNNIPDKDITMVFEILYILEIDGKIIKNSLSPSAQIEEVCKMIRSIESNEIKTESVNLYNALKYVRELAEGEKEQKYRGLIDVDCFILELHKCILGSGNQGGEFSTNRRLGIVDPHTGERHEYPKFETVEHARHTVQQVIDQYNALLDEIKLSYNEDSKSAIENLHKLSAFLLFKMTYYHPFGDGNGRLARLLSSYALFLIAPFPTPMYGLFSPSTRGEYLAALIEGRNNSGIFSTLTALIIESSYYTWKAFYEVVRMAQKEEQTWKELLNSCANIAKILEARFE